MSERTKEPRRCTLRVYDDGRSPITTINGRGVDNVGSYAIDIEAGDEVEMHGRRWVVEECGSRIQTGNSEVGEGNYVYVRLVQHRGGK